VDVKIVEKKEPNRYLIGKRYELELARKLHKYGFAVIRAPASGRKAKRVPYPDIVAIQQLKTKHLLVHYRELLKLERFKPIHVIEFIWIARYKFTENKNKSLYILYKVET